MSSITTPGINLAKETPYAELDVGLGKKPQYIRLTLRVHNDARYPSDIACEMREEDWHTIHDAGEMLARQVCAVSAHSSTEHRIEHDKIRDAYCLMAMLDLNGEAPSTVASYITHGHIYSRLQDFCLNEQVRLTTEPCAYTLATAMLAEIDNHSAGKKPTSTTIDIGREGDLSLPPLGRGPAS